MTGPIGFSSSNKRLESGWALSPDQEQFHERLRRNIQQLDGEVHHQFGYDAASSFGLSYAYFGGVIDDGIAWTAVPDDSIVLPDNQVSYVERDPGTGAVSTNVVGWTYALVPMAIVTTAHGRISDVVDSRPHDTSGGGGGGGGCATFACLAGQALDSQIAQSSVVQHQAALTIQETQIPNGSILARVADNETITGTYNFTPAAGSPFLVGNSGLVTDLNADYLDGEHGVYYTNLDNILINVIGTPTYVSAQEELFLSGSAGIITGGAVTDAGGATIDVAAGEGFIRSSDSALADLLSFEWSASLGLAIPVDTQRWVVVDYNAGAPAVALETSFTSTQDKILLGTVVNEAGTLHIAGFRDETTSGVHEILHAMREVHGIIRADALGGLIIGETGTRNVTVSAGEIYWGSQEFSYSAIDTSGADTFETYYQTGGVWTHATGVSQWPNTQYNDTTSGLVAMTPNRYANLWWYADIEGELVMVWGTDQYVTLGGALDEEPPAVPPRVESHCLLLGRYVFQNAAATTSQIDSAFNVTLSQTGVTDHGALSGLTDDDHTQYLLLAGRGGQTIDDALTITDDVTMTQTGSTSLRMVSEVDSGSPYIQMDRARSGGAAPNSGQDLGYIRARGWDGVSAYQESARVEFETVGTHSVTNAGGEIKFLTVEENDAGFVLTERFRVGDSFLSMYAHTRNTAGTTFSTSTGSNTVDAIIIDDDNASGSGNYGSSIGWSKLGALGRRAAIVQQQTGADDDQIGLAFFAHPSGTGSDALQLMMELGYVGDPDGVKFTEGAVAIGDTGTAGELVIGSASSGGTLTLGSNIVSTTCDLRLRDNANIATDANMNFFIDADNNSAAEKFSWNTNAEALTGAETQMMQLTEGGTLTLTGFFNVGGGTPTGHRIYAYHGTTNIVATLESGDANVWLAMADSASTSQTANMIGVQGDQWVIRAASADRVKVTSAYLRPNTPSGLALGSATNYWDEIHTGDDLYMYGTRPITMDADAGTINMKGSAGGWVVGTKVEGSAGTALGYSTGAKGSADTLSYFFFGTYTTELARIYDVGVAAAGASTMYLGLDDVNYGDLRLFGRATTYTHGGRILFYTAADYDTNVDYYTVRASGEDFHVQREAVSILYYDQSSTSWLAGSYSWAADMQFRIVTASGYDSTFWQGEVSSNYGFRWLYQGSSSNDLYLYRHDNSAPGALVITVDRGTGEVTFAGDVTIGGDLDLGTNDITCNSLTGGLNGIIAVGNNGKIRSGVNDSVSSPGFSWAGFTNYGMWYSSGAVEFAVNGNDAGGWTASTTARATRLRVWDVDNGAIETVTVGVADSGGSGYKLLRIPN